MNIWQGISFYSRSSTSNKDRIDMIYFSFGSNMSSARLAARGLSVSSKGLGYLYKHKLAFHKVSSKDGSGKCDIIRTGELSDYVIGVLYDLKPSHKSALDKHEGVGFGYEVKDVQIQTLTDEKVLAFAYHATNINPDLKPYHWYKKHVVFGAIENNFPTEYIDQIESIKSIDDPDPNRAIKELSIYNICQ